MAKTIAQLRAEAQTIKNATIVGENTATRVGGFGEDIVDYLDTEIIDSNFATGEAVGDVSVFDDVADLENKTEAQKALMLPNGKMIYDNEVATSSMTPFVIYNNLVWDNGSLSPGSGTKDRYNCYEFDVIPTKRYKVTSLVQGSGFHQLVFKSAANAVTGTLNNVTQAQTLTTILDSTNIPQNTAKVFVNGYVENGDAITCGELLPVIELAEKVPYLCDEVNPPYETLDISSCLRINANIDANNKYATNTNVFMRFYPITESGTYEIAAINGLASYAIVTTDEVTIGGSVPYAAGYGVVYMSRFDVATVTLPSGVFVYFRDDGDPAGRVLPRLRKIGDNSVVHHSELPSIEAKKINCLFVGNSVSQDHVSYVPWLLRKTYGDDVDFRVCIAYKASYTIDKYVSDIITGNVNLDIFSVAENVANWTNTNNYPWASIWVNFGHFDLICFEGYFNHGTSSAGFVEDPTKFADFIADLRTRQSEPFKLGYLMHQTYTTSTHTEADAWTRIMGGAEYAIQHCPVSILFPCGVATKLVNGVIPQSFLTNDNTHNQQGLPCIMGGYVIIEELARYVGLPSRITNNPIRIDAPTETALNIPGTNGSLQIGTDSQNAICQDAAVQSVKFGDYMMVTNGGGIVQ